MKEVILNPEPETSGGVRLPITARLEIGQVSSLSNQATPIKFDMKSAVEAYLNKRQTFQRVVDGPADVTFRLSANFIFGSDGSNFTYTFKLHGVLDSNGVQAGDYRSEATARGGMVRFTAMADQLPMNEAATQALDKLFLLMEMDRMQILAKLGKGPSLQNGAIASSPKPLDKPVDDVSIIPDFKAEARENDIAVVIGIENYRALPKSDFSASDAGLVKGYLKALGYQERNIAYATDGSANLSDIKKSIEKWLPNKVKKNSRVFIYYSGHGAPDPATGDAYIVPHDGDPNYLEETGYALKRLYEQLARLNADEVIVALDSCFSGAGGRSVLAKGARPIVMTVADAALPPNVAVITATEGMQISTSSPEKEHGVFTYYFLKAIKSGKKDLREIYAYIKPLVEDEAKGLNVTQSPTMKPEPEKTTGRFRLR